MNINNAYNKQIINHIHDNDQESELSIVNKMKHMLIFPVVMRYIVFIDLIFSSKFKL
jgi:hypothetical protein